MLVCDVNFLVMPPEAKGNLCIDINSILSLRISTTKRSLRAIYVKFVKTSCCTWPEISYMGNPLFSLIPCLVTGGNTNHIHGWNAKANYLPYVSCRKFRHLNDLQITFQNNVEENMMLNRKSTHSCLQNQKFLTVHPQDYVYVSSRLCLWIKTMFMYPQASVQHLYDIFLLGN